MSEKIVWGGAVLVTEMSDIEARFERQSGLLCARVCRVKNKTKRDDAIRELRAFIGGRMTQGIGVLPETRLSELDVLGEQSEERSGLALIVLQRRRFIDAIRHGVSLEDWDGTQVR